MRAVYTFLTLLLLSQAPAALAGCAIQPDGNGHVTIPDGQTSIADDAFDGCTSLTSVTIPDSVTSIGNYAFNCYGAETALTSVTIGNGVTSIGEGAFYACTALQAITIPDSVTSIGGAAFLETGITSITFMSSAVSIDNGRGGILRETDSLNQICGVDATVAPFNGMHIYPNNMLVDQTTQAQCTEPACPAGVSGVKWCTPLCTSPDTTGYQVTETNLAPDSFDVSATCATGAVGTASVSACSASGQPYVLSGCRVTYDCASPATSGAFVLADDCTLNGEVSLTGDLDILGVVKGDGSYPVITAASSSRHFKITSGAHKLTLKYLKMVDGNVDDSYTDYQGGSIYVKDVAATLNISDSEFFNNRGGQYGGAIYAYDGQPTVLISDVSFSQNDASNGGAVYIQLGALVDYSCIYTANTAENKGGALFLRDGSHSSFFNSSLVSNTAGNGGGGIYIEGGDSISSSFLDMSSVTLQSNKQTNGGTSGSYGGGGLLIYKVVTANIRECTFIENEVTADSGSGKHGHQIFTRKSGSQIPSIAIVNTKFTDIAGDNAFYGYDGSSGGVDKYVSPTTCASNPCTVTPFTGSCSARAVPKRGVLCDYASSITCPSGSYSKTIDDTTLLPPSESACGSISEWDCNRSAGIFLRSTDCTMSDEIAVSGDFTVTGKETHQIFTHVVQEKRFRTRHKAVMVDIVAENFANCLT